MSRTRRFLCYSSAAPEYHRRRLWTAAFVAVGLVLMQGHLPSPAVGYAAAVTAATAVHAVWRMVRPGATALDSILLDSTVILLFLAVVRPPPGVHAVAVLVMVIPAWLFLSAGTMSWTVAYSLLGLAGVGWAFGPPERHGTVDAFLAFVLLLATLPVVAWLIQRLVSTLLEGRLLAGRLEQAASRFEHLFQRSVVPMLRASLDGRVLDANSSLLALFRAPDLATLQREPLLARYVDHRQRRELITALEERGAVRGLEVRLRRLDGSELWARVAASLEETEEGSVIEGIIEDVTERKQAEREAQLAATVLDQVHNSVIVTDAAGTVLSWNPAAERMYGWTADEAVGRSILDVTVPAGGRPAAEAILDGLTRHGVWEGEFEVRRKDGSVFSAWVTDAMLRDDAGTPIGVVGVSTDLTDRKRAEAEARRQGDLARAVLESVHVPLTVVSRSGTILAVNRAWASFAEGQGTPWSLVRPGVTVAELRAALPPGRPGALRVFAGVEAVASGRRERFSREYAHDAGGEERWYQLEVAPLPGTGAVVAYRDITDERLARAALESVIRAKDEFIASISHELRTPLSVVVGLSQELRDGRVDGAEAAELQAMLAEQALEVSYLVEDLLVAARVDSDAITVAREEVDLAAEVCSVLRTLEPGSGTIELQAPSRPVVLADPLRVRQVVRNLLHNASRHGDPPVRVELGADEQAAWVSVHDGGRGIPHDALDRLFAPYARFHQSHGQPSSVGLGLHVSRRLAQLMGGSLVYGRPGGVTSFTLTLPRPPRSPDGSRPLPEALVRP